MMSFREHKGYWTAVGFLLLIYFVGWLGLSKPTGENYTFILSLTALNLILTTLILLIFHRDWNKPFVLSILFIALAGFGVEVLGVHTGLIFGSYQYGKTLGWQVMQVPLIIGVNWLLLVYSVSVVLNKIKHLFIFCLAGGLIMTGLDVLIEPVAIELDFWQWEKGVIPMQNYLAWFLVFFLMLMFFRIINPGLKNKIAKVVLVLQFLFFAALNLTLK